VTERCVAFVVDGVCRGFAAVEVAATLRCAEAAVVVTAVPRRADGVAGGGGVGVEFGSAGAQSSREPWCPG
jgi:hypothetical protein